MKAENLPGTEVFTDPFGEERVRLTPEAARLVGDEHLAACLEKCKGGVHEPGYPHHPFCACGEKLVSGREDDARKL